MTSKDVTHGFFIPSMRVKSDVLPATYTYLSFKPIKTGEYQVFCTHYCGDEHSHMLAKLEVVPRAEYDRWLNDKSEETKMASMSPAELGKKLYAEKACIGCHSLDGSNMSGPSWLKLSGREEVLADDTKVKVDENYLRESILNPNAKVVKGYGPPSVMPAFEGQLKDNEVDGLIAYIKTIDGSQKAEVKAEPAKDEKALADMTPVERGQKIYKEKLCITCHSLDGSKVVGPTFKGVYGRAEKMQGGAAITVDDAYLKESIYEPAAKIVEGYPPAMPPFKGMLSDADVADVIEFLKTVK
jgi:cytochrome c oxidase subunit 2